MVALNFISDAFAQLSVAENLIVSTLEHPLVIHVVKSSNLKTGAISSITLMICTYRICYRYCVFDIAGIHRHGWLYCSQSVIDNDIRCMFVLTRIKLTPVNQSPGTYDLVTCWIYYGKDLIIVSYAYLLTFVIGDDRSPACCCIGTILRKSQVNVLSSGKITSKSDLCLT